MKIKSVNNMLPYWIFSRFSSPGSGLCSGILGVCQVKCMCIAFLS